MNVLCARITLIEYLLKEAVSLEATISGRDFYRNNVIFKY